MKSSNKLQRWDIHKDYVGWNLIVDSQHFVRHVHDYALQKLSNTEYNKEKWNSAMKSYKRVEKALLKFESEIATILEVNTDER